MTRHPGGRAHTTRMLALARLSPPCRILDLGAGDGETVRHLRGLGFEASGIDLAPGPDVEPGDLLSAPYPDAHFGALISQCAFYAAGDPDLAFRESRRLLCPGGRLLISDVSFGGGEGLRDAAQRAGLRVLLTEDMTPLWRDYYIESIWKGTAWHVPCGCPRDPCGYFLMICERRNEHGPV